MGGFFAVASKESCVLDLFYGTDYHSHLGTRRAGMAVYGNGSFERSIHNIQNTPFRTKFDSEIDELKGPLGIGCISDFEPQPLLIQSHLGSFAIATVGKINNHDDVSGSGVFVYLKSWSFLAVSIFAMNSSDIGKYKIKLSFSS